MRERKTPRYRVTKDLFAWVRNGTEIVGQVHNIGEGGLSLEYIWFPRATSGKPHSTQIKVDLVARDGVFHLAQIPCSVAYDVRVPRRFPGAWDVESRRCGIRFETLSRSQQKGLSSLFTAHGVVAEKTL